LFDSELANEGVGELERIRWVWDEYGEAVPSR
jgi:hypothetical protein